MVVQEMSGRLFIFGLALLVIQFTVVQGQSTIQGFLSIDCGLPKGKNYNDKKGIPYISDSEFIDTGESNVVSTEFFLTGSPRNYLRSFPNGTRNCYNVKPVVEGWLYLVRARFKYGNYDGQNTLPQFDLYLGINYWQTITLESSDYGLIVEILVVAVSNYMSICLVNTNQGTPFISVIELRRLPNILYPEANISQSLVMVDRQNLGGTKDIRYPEDTYDRLWLTDDEEVQYPAVNTLNTSSSVLTSFFTEPSRIMQSFAYPKTTTDLSYYDSEKPLGACPSTRAYFIFYFAELEKLLQNESRILHVSLNGIVVSDEIQPEYLKTTTFDKSISFDVNLNFSVEKAPNSTKPPILNAFELYRIIDLTCQSGTRREDVDAMRDIKAIYKVKRNWNGDPCAPTGYMWEGLHCSNNGSYSLLITSLNLSSSGLTGEISASLAHLSALQYLDLSSNSLIGEIPDFLSELSQLKVLNLANNNLTGSISKVLLDMSSKGQLNLSTDGNPNLCINPDSCPEERRKKNKRVLPVVVSCIVVVVLLVLVLIISVWRCKRRSRSTECSLSLFCSDTRKFTYDELEDITDNFKEEIGSGGFGQVFLGKFEYTQVAVKVLKESTSLAQGLEGFQTEANLLSKIHHRNLVPLIGYCNDDINHLALIYEYMEGGSLKDHLSGRNKRTPLSWRHRLRIACETAQGLEYLHNGCKPRIIHRDIKPGNILLTRELEVCIADFGLSKMFESNDVQTHMLSTGCAGTPAYCDPEYARTKKLRTKSDVYSFGVVVVNLITGLPATVDGEVVSDIVAWIQRRRSGEEIREIFDKKIEEDYDAHSVLKLVKIAKECTNSKARRRPDISKVVRDLKDCLGESYMRSRTSSTSRVNGGPLEEDVLVSHVEEEEEAIAPV